MSYAPAPQMGGSMRNQPDADKGSVLVLVVETDPYMTRITSKRITSGTAELDDVPRKANE
jgi:hypothetical protein